MLSLFFKDLKIRSHNLRDFLHTPHQSDFPILPVSPPQVIAYINKIPALYNSFMYYLRQYQLPNYFLSLSHLWPLTENNLVIHSTIWGSTKVTGSTDAGVTEEHTEHPD